MNVKELIKALKKLNETDEVMINDRAPLILIGRLDSKSISLVCANHFQKVFNELKDNHKKSSVPKV